MSDRARVLVFGFTEEEAARVDEVLGAAGAPPATRIRPGQRNVVLGEIIRAEAQGPGHEPCGGPQPPPGEKEEPPVVLFHNLSDTGITTLMRLVRQLPVARPIFAVVTPTSITWTLENLIEHLVQEQQAFEGRDQGRGGGSA